MFKVRCKEDISEVFAVIYRRSQKGKLMVSVELVETVDTNMGKRQHLIVARGGSIKKER